MEPVTHVLTGACLARSGFNRKAAYATLTMAIAAEFPDVDSLWSVRGPVAGFEHHRGITHTLLGVPFEAALLVGLAWLLHRWRLRRHGKADRPVTAAPVRWGWLYAGVLVALLSHLLLDYTNNYGLRPFFPFNAHWYAASIVFIFDPLLFGILLLALIAPWIFRLVGSEIGARREPFQGRGFAISALLLMVLYWTFREVEHNHAVDLAMQQSLEQPGAAAPTPPDSDAPLPAPVSPVYLQPLRVLANPDPLSPFRWYTVTDFGPVYQLGTADTAVGTFVPAGWTQPKPSQFDSADRKAFRRAEASELGRVYLDWSPMAFVTVLNAGNGVPGQVTTVVFRDPRFMGDTALLHRSGHTPLTGTVALDAAGHVVDETLDGRSAAAAGQTSP